MDHLPAPDRGGGQRRVLVEPPDTRRTRHDRMIVTACGAALTLVALMCGIAGMFALWATSWSEGDPECEPVTIGDCIAPADIAPAATAGMTAIAAMGLVIGVGFIVATMAIISNVTTWQPRPLSGTAVAVGLGIAAVVVSWVLATLLSCALSLTQVIPLIELSLQRLTAT